MYNDLTRLPPSIDVTGNPFDREDDSARSPWHGRCAGMLLLTEDHAGACVDTRAFVVEHPYGAR